MSNAFWRLRIVCEHQKYTDSSISEIILYNLQLIIVVLKRLFLQNFVLLY